jgi:peptidoglycan hydrolase CwlO-like protein
MNVLLEDIQSKVTAIAEGHGLLATRLVELDRKIDAVDAKVDAVDAKVDAVDAKVEALSVRLTKLERRVGGIEKTLKNGAAKKSHGPTRKRRPS